MITTPLPPHQIEDSSKFTPLQSQEVLQEITEVPDLNRDLFTIQLDNCDTQNTLSTYTYIPDSNRASTATATGEILNRKLKQCYKTVGVKIA